MPRNETSPLTIWRASDRAECDGHLEYDAYFTTEEYAAAGLDAHRRAALEEIGVDTTGKVGRWLERAYADRFDTVWSIERVEVRL